MTRDESMLLLKQKVADLGQAEVARCLGKSPTTISQMLAGKYQAAPDRVLKRVVEVFGGLSVLCPVLGEIPLSRCAEERKKGFTIANHQAVQLWKACQKCVQKTEKSDFLKTALRVMGGTDL